MHSKVFNYTIDGNLQVIIKKFKKKLKIPPQPRSSAIQCFTCVINAFLTEIGTYNIKKVLTTYILYIYNIFTFDITYLE